MSMSPEVAAHLEQVSPVKRRRDATTLLELFARATGQEPVLHGGIIGFGSYRYRYESGRQGEAPAASFAPRKAATVVYLPDGIAFHPELERLGPHKTGVGCLYLTDLEQNDLEVLERVVRASYERVTGGSGHDRDSERERDGEREREGKVGDRDSEQEGG